MSPMGFFPSLTSTSVTLSFSFVPPITYIFTVSVSVASIKTTWADLIVEERLLKTVQLKEAHYGHMQKLRSHG